MAQENVVDVPQELPTAIFHHSPTHSLTLDSGIQPPNQSSERKDREVIFLYSFSSVLGLVIVYIN